MFLNMITQYFFFVQAKYENFGASTSTLLLMSMWNTLFFAGPRYNFKFGGSTVIT